MNPLFADTSFYVAVFNPHDSIHARATAVAATHDGPVVTTEFVLLEVANFFSHPDGRATFKTMLESLAVAEDVTIVPASAELFAKGLALFHARPDKSWSLTDCISFVVMDEMGLTDALTADHHFEQAAFNALLM